MKVNSKVFTERTDMFADIQIPNCHPKELCTVCERIMNMCIAVGYACPVEHSVSELDKLLAVDYWTKYDNLSPNIFGNVSSFKQWYLKATELDTVSRGRRWLHQCHYIIYEPGVEDRAEQAAANYRQAIKGGK